MKVGIFDPYLDTLGGGERYMMTIAECLGKAGHQVDIFWPNKKLKKKIEARLNLDLSESKFCSPIKNLFKKWQTHRNYHLFFHLSDGSIPLMFAQKNILHFQVPFHNVGGKKTWNSLKLNLIDSIICNSNFTKKFIDEEYGVNSVVIYPPVDVKNFKPSKKENIILSVGRFSQLMQAKRQDILVDSFKQLRKKLSGWRLVLAGSTDVGKDELFERLKSKAEGQPVEIHKNLPFQELKKLYAKAKIFWSAAGFGVDEEKEPEKVEHFGIVTVEAMAAGCLPVVVRKGGLKEIVEHNFDGFLWETKKDLVKYTLQLINEEDLRKKLSHQAIKSAQKFSKERFDEEIKELIF